jgi:hypothetical protein
LYIKFIHVFFVMIWAWSTAVAYGWYVKGAFLKWEANPDDPEGIRRRNRAIEQFDRGVILEHIAFPIVIVSGPLLFVITGWGLDNPWLLLKLLVVVFIFVPMEIFDYYLSHFGGNKYKLRLRGESEKYERAVRRHWLFLKITTPLIMIFVPLVIFLSIVKPALW